MAVKKLIKKAELLGFSPQAQCIATEISDVRRKWHIPPAFSVEFVSYFLDRNNRMNSMSKRLDELKAQNKQLKETEEEVRAKYEQMADIYDKAKNDERQLRERAQALWSLLAELGRRAFTLPPLLESPVKQVQRSPARAKLVEKVRQSRKIAPLTSLKGPVVLNKCGLCHGSHDQHLLALCDSCGLHYHLKCLDPPLTRMPKKTR